MCFFLYGGVKRGNPEANKGGFGYDCYCIIFFVQHSLFFVVDTFLLFYICTPFVCLVMR